MRRTNSFAPHVLSVNFAEVEVQLPASGVILTFRCGAHAEPVPENLVEVARMTPDARWHGSILIAAGSWLNARQAGAEAIAQYRQEACARHA